MVEALFEVLVKPEYRRGTLIDGFPRTQIQVRRAHQHVLLPWLVVGRS